MDQTAMTMCNDNGLPMRVFGMEGEGTSPAPSSESRSAPPSTPDHAARDHTSVDCHLAQPDTQGETRD